MARVVGSFDVRSVLSCGMFLVTSRLYQPTGHDAGEDRLPCLGGCKFIDSDVICWYMVLSSYMYILYIFRYVYLDFIIHDYVCSMCTIFLYISIRHICTYIYRLVMMFHICIYIQYACLIYDILEKYQFKTLNNIHNMRQHASTNICMFIFWHSGKTRNTMKQIYLVCTFWYSGIRGQQWNKNDNNTISRYSGSIIRLTRCFQDPGMI